MVHQLTLGLQNRDGHKEDNVSKVHTTQIKTCEAGVTHTDETILKNVY